MRENEERRIRKRIKCFSGGNRQNITTMESRFSYMLCYLKRKIGVDATGRNIGPVGWSVGLFGRMVDQSACFIIFDGIHLNETRDLEYLDEKSVDVKRLTFPCRDVSAFTDVYHA